MKTNSSKNDISKGWCTTKLGNIAVIVMGQSPKGSSYNKNGGGKPLINGPTEFTGLYPIKIQWTTTPTKMCEIGDVLLCVRGSSTGRINIANDEYCIGRGVAAIRASGKTSQAYLKQMVGLIVEQILKHTSGSTFPNIDSSSLKKISIVLPPLTEQNRIASVLETWDQAIEKLKRKIEIKKQIKKGLMQNLLAGKRRLTGFKGEWETVEIGELLDYEQPTKYIVKSTDYDHVHKTPVLTANKGFILGYTNETKDIYKNYPVIIFDDFTADNKFVDFAFKVKSSAIKILSPKNQNVNLKFVFEKIQLIKFTVGQHKRHYLSEYQYITIDIPSIKEQTAIANILTTADGEITTLEKKLFILKNQKKYLLNNLITGNIRTPVKLLEKVQS
ncbi:MAG: hypothetical protein A3I68_01640 [Candidatus Melainabacteria bacterium RIFCSPLOWO2_02_FULL_35_15]|nr:MAG: hypothetical protein A3F80_04950 [Candidatus Melainabacteria bacterium RIFCSPLOWO2_12_FULL_35_11]OGI13013.1 MAG: hypothetical protein A3I68_01640 [Candidatus Melainabacteria bacterium RIFCSPLOWO2_02_FULL_35_15]